MNNTIKSYLYPILAGILIGLGDIIYVFNVNHILGAFLFSLGLLSILIKGYPLYTGRIGYITSIKKLPSLLLVLLLNFIGISLICWLITYSRLDLSSINNIVEVKCNQSLFSSFILSYGCGIMMYLAVNGWNEYHNPIMVIMPIMFFILCGFEHCIANFGYYIMYMAENNIALPISAYINLLIMIIGNALGSLTFSKI